MKNKLLVILMLALPILSIAQGSEQYLVNSKTLNMRSGPGKEYEIVGTLNIGDVVKVLEKSSNGWWQVNFDGLTGYVFSQFLKKDPYSGWEKKDYATGVTPECENVTPEYDYSLDNYLRINVGSGTDVVVKLMRMDSYEDQCIRIVYVRSRETFDIKNIPQGRYYLKIAYGKDYRQKIVDNVCYVKFMSNAQYEKGNQILDFFKVKQPNRRLGNDIYENWSIPSYELSLDVIMTKNSKKAFKANNISEAEFNK